MEKFLHPVELKNVSYERNKFKFQKKLKSFTFLTATLMLMFFSFTASATIKYKISKTYKSTSFTLSNFEEEWTLIHSDSFTKVFAQKVTCSGASSVKLKIENLSSHEINLTYKFSKSEKESREISLFPLQKLEGICSDDYKNLLIEHLESNDTEIKILIIYKSN